MWKYRTYHGLFLVSLIIISTNVLHGVVKHLTHPLTSIGHGSSQVITTDDKQLVWFDCSKCEKARWMCRDPTDVERASPEFFTEPQLDCVTGDGEVYTDCMPEEEPTCLVGCGWCAFLALGNCVVAKWCCVYGDKHWNKWRLLKL